MTTLCQWRAAIHQSRFMILYDIFSLRRQDETKNSRFAIERKNNVDTKPQARINFDVTSFRRKQVLQNFIVGTDGPTDGWTDGRMDGVNYRGATSRLKTNGLPIFYLRQRNKRETKGKKILVQITFL
jgi:hypothetical protein